MQDDHTNILLVEDDPTYAEQSQRMLRFQREDYRVDIAASAEEGLDRIGQERYHLLLLDMSLPGMNGLEALEEISKARIEIPVIFLVQEGEEECAQRALALGAFDYLMKVGGFFSALPFTVDRALNWQRIKGRPTEEIPKPQRWENAELQLQMVEDIVNLNTFIHQVPLEQVIKKVTELACHYFHFEKAVFYLHDPQRSVFLKAVSSGQEAKEDENTQEISQDFVKRIFANDHIVKILYCSQQKEQAKEAFSLPDRNDQRTQERRATNVWLKGDKIFLNFTDREGASLAYLVLEDPVDRKIPSHQAFLSMKIFTKLISLLLQHFLLLEEKDRKIKRLKQILITSNIFKLGLPLKNLFREAVWNVRFSLGFNLVLLGILVEKTGRLEIKASACDDRQKQRWLQGLTFPLKSVAPLLRNQFKVSDSYFIVQKETQFSIIKDIYREHNYFPEELKDWPPDALLLTPINNREGKIIGFLITNDPTDGKKPTVEDVRLLERLSKQVATAIENRMLYLRVKRRINELKEEIKNLKTEIKRLTAPEHHSEEKKLGKLIFRWSMRD